MLVRAIPPLYRFSPAILAIGLLMSAQEHEIEIAVPARLRVERTPERLSIAFDKTSVQTVSLTTDRNLKLGKKYELRVYGESDPRPVNAGRIGYASIPQPVDLTSPGYLNGTTFLNLTQDNIPATGKRYRIEKTIYIFETDVPPQHMWNPASSRYRVLWTRTLNEVQ